MKKEWVRPELYIEEYELSQRVATSCGTKTYIYVEPGGTLNFATGCQKKPGEYYNGSGHWYYKGQIKDSDGDGRISLEEWKSAIGSALNGNETGQGHYKEHTQSVTIEGKSYEFTVEEPFSS